MGKIKKNTLVKASVGTAVIVIVCIMFAFIFRQIKYTIFEERSANLNLVMSKLSLNINMILKNKWDDLEYLKNDIDDNNYDDLNNFLVNIEKLESYFEKGNLSLYAMDKTGVCYGNITEKFTLNNELVSQNKNNMVYVTTLSGIGRNTESILFLSKLKNPIIIDEIEFSHLILESDMTAFEEFLTLKDYGKYSSTYMIHQDGTHIYKRKEADVLNIEDNILSVMENSEFLYKRDKNKFFSDISNNISDTVYIKYNGSEYFVAYQNLDINDWFAVIFIPANIVGKNTQRLVFSITVYVFILAAIIFLLLIGAIAINEFNIHKKQNIINESLRKAALAEKQANISKTRFLSAMSHDIRTPMNAIIGMTNLAADEVDSESKAGEYLHKIADAGNHLVKLINDILDISAYESGNYNLNPTGFSIAEMRDNLLNMGRPLLNNRELQFDVRMNNIEKEYIYADKIRLNQIFVNLLSNAIKYTPDGGRVTVEIREEKIVNRPENVRLFFRISDTGIGMSEEFMRVMYDSFERSVHTNTYKVEGYGLGLAIVKQLVELMNGKIFCESEINKGTVFTVVIDVPIFHNFEEIDELMLDSNIVINEDISNLRVLVAEDYDINWEILKKTLSKYEINASHAKNGKMCVEMVEQNEYDVILMDVQMPIMDGIEATKKIRSMPCGKDIIIIAATADAFTDDIANCIDAGMDSHISKPIDVEILISELVKIRNRKKRQSQK